MFDVSDSRGSRTVGGTDRETVIDRLIGEPSPDGGDRVLWEGGRVVAVIRSGGGELPAIVESR